MLFLQRLLARPVALFCVQVVFVTHLQWCTEEADSLPAAKGSVSRVEDESQNCAAPVDVHVEDVAGSTWNEGLVPFIGSGE